MSEQWTDFCLRLSPSSGGDSELFTIIVTDHLRWLTGHIKDLESHIVLVQNACNSTTNPSVQGEVDVIIDLSRQLPRPWRYFQFDGGKLGKKGIRNDS